VRRQSLLSAKDGGGFVAVKVEGRIQYLLRKELNIKGFFLISLLISSSSLNSAGVTHIFRNGYCETIRK